MSALSAAAGALFAGFLFTASARAAPVEQSPTRSLWLAPTYDFMATDAFAPSSRHGFGFSGAYEFHVSPRFNLGLTLAYRLYPGERRTQQLGYGTVLKHFFSEQWTSRHGVYPFLDYGLLLQQTFVQGRTGNAVSHDTRLGGGILVRVSGATLFAGVGAHYSRVDAFDRESIWIPYFDLAAGWVLTF